MRVNIYSDGSAKKDGRGGYGTVLQCRFEGELKEKEIYDGYENTTNNRMELMGAIAGLKAVKYPCDVTVITDSKYVVSAFNENWIDGWLRNNWRTAGKKPVKNRDLWEILIKEVEKMERVSFVWIKGHNGHPENERCDKLANLGAGMKVLKKDGKREM